MMAGNSGVAAMMAEDSGMMAMTAGDSGMVAMLKSSSISLTVRSHRRRRERQSDRKSIIFNVSEARLGQCGHRGELKSGQIYGNEL